MSARGSQSSGLNGYGQLNKQCPAGIACRTLPIWNTYEKLTNFVTYAGSLFVFLAPHLSPGMDNQVYGAGGSGNGVAFTQVDCPRALTAAILK